MQLEISSSVDGEVPAPQAEVEKIVAHNLRSQPGAYETAGSVLGTIAGIVRYDRPDNWVELRNAQIRDLTPEQVNAAARTLEPGALPWVVVGDLKQIEQPVRALALGEVRDRQSTRMNSSP